MTATNRSALLLAMTAAALSPGCIALDPGEGYIEEADIDSDSALATVAMTGSTWMANLPGSISLSQVDIPGTHDSGARIGGVFVATQDLSISQQLDAGVRYLDIRLRHFEDALVVHHGAFYQELNFDDVLIACTSFLAAHPSETILMQVKEEHTPAGNTRSFEQTFLTRYVSTPAYQPYFHLTDAVPTLDAVRGKIVLVRRFHAGQQLGIDATDWADNASYDDVGSKVSIQDRYNTNPAQKWTDMRYFFNRTRTTVDSRLRLNFASGYESILGLPAIRNVSDYVNPRLEGYFSHHFATLYRHGVVLMDFPSTSLIEKIYRANFSGAAPAAKRNPVAFDVRIYEDAGFQGTYANLMQSDSPVNVAELEWLGIRNDQVSSVEVKPGLEVLLHEHSGVAGYTKSLRESWSNLGDSFNDLTSSLTIRPVPTGVIFFRDCGFQGPNPSPQVFGPGYWSTSIFDQVGNDAVSSLRIGGSDRVTIYEHVGPAGASELHTASSGCLSTFNDRLSSAVITR
jgi:1-phosphatidylinositol phosphodiesterase